jgi:hypothetical protein
MKSNIDSGDLYNTLDDATRLAQIAQLFDGGFSFHFGTPAFAKTG